MNRLAVVSVVALLAGLSSSGTAPAAVLNLTGTCDVFPHSPPSCANVGLAGVTSHVELGSVELDDALFSPGGFFESEALVSYDFSFGNFALSSHDVPAQAFAGNWGATPGSIRDLSMFASASDDREHPGRLISLGIDSTGGFFVASHDGYRQPNPGGQSFETDNGNWAGFSVDRHIAPVPLPPAGLLLMGGLAGLAALRLRRRTGEAA